MTCSIFTKPLFFIKLFVGIITGSIAVTADASKKVTFEARGDVPAISGNHIEGFKVSNRETSLLPKMGGNGTKIFVFSGFMIICCSLVLYFRFKRKGA